jgi:uracil-DNA glycosylase family 4
VRRAAFRDETYWARPVPGFGDPHARVLVVGLAPAAHGANRTGRMFTGDGTGGAGDFLMAALQRAGFSNRSASTHTGDGLRLTNVYVTAAVRCAPPGNKPLPDEIRACNKHLEHEVRLLPHLRVVVALGHLAWNAWFQLMARTGGVVRPRPRFGHGTVARLDEPKLALVGCYHPSRQNTSTGRLTPAMYDTIFKNIVPQCLSVPFGV